MHELDPKAKFHAPRNSLLECDQSMRLNRQPQDISVSEEGSIVRLAATLGTPRVVLMHTRGGFEQKWQKQVLPSTFPEALSLISSLTVEMVFSAKANIIANHILTSLRF